MRPTSLFSEGSSQRTQGATEVDVPVEGDSPHIQGGAKNIGKPNTGIPIRDVSSSYASVVVGHRKNTIGRGVEGKKIQGGAKNIGKPNTGIPITNGLSSYASVVVGHRKNTTGRGVEGKKKSALGGVKIWLESSRNLSKKSVIGQREQVGKKLVSDSRCAYRDSCKASTLG
ncbi:hypothetical protein CMV_008167 [Castanea mollissima]|uniref:Uncharacterized protein n=1 Tax=Castanea mollissima TaxID=60419 RepID=A0A8J4R7V1_9ROSI|nr:hypothetical protein CMV_008167 [Castanea mollissima]